MQWYKINSDMISNPKFGVIAQKAKCSIPEAITIWIYLLEQAAKEEAAGHVGNINFEEISYLLRMDEGVIEVIINIMRERGMLEKNSVKNWDKYQLQTSTERVRKWREEQKKKKKQLDSDNETLRNVAETDETLHNVPPVTETLHETHETHETARSDQIDKIRKNNSKVGVIRIEENQNNPQTYPHDDDDDNNNFKNNNDDDLIDDEGMQMQIELGKALQRPLIELSKTQQKTVEEWIELYNTDMRRLTGAIKKASEYFRENNPGRPLIFKYLESTIKNDYREWMTQMANKDVKEIDVKEILAMEKRKRIKSLME